MLGINLNSDSVMATLWAIFVYKKQDKIQFQ